VILGLGVFWTILFTRVAPAAGSLIRSSWRSACGAAGRVSARCADVMQISEELDQRRGRSRGLWRTSPGARAAIALRLLASFVLCSLTMIKAFARPSPG